MDDFVVGLRALCKYLGCGQAALMSMIRNEGLPAALTGGRWRALRSDIAAWQRGQVAAQSSRQEGDGSHGKRSAARVRRGRPRRRGNAGA